MSHQPTKLEVRASSMTTVECEGFALKRLFFALAPKHKDDGGLETWNLSHPVISLETHCTCLDFYTFSRLITMVQLGLSVDDEFILVVAAVVRDISCGTFRSS